MNTYDVWIVERALAFAVVHPAFAQLVDVRRSKIRQGGHGVLRIVAPASLHLHLHKVLILFSQKAMASMVPTPPSNTRELLIVYGKHKYNLEVGGKGVHYDGATTFTQAEKTTSPLTVDTVKHLLCRRWLTQIPTQWVKLFAKGKELKNEDSIETFCKKPGKVTKLRLQFSGEFAELGAKERERRLTLHGARASNDAASLAPPSSLGKNEKVDDLTSDAGVNSSVGNRELVAPHHQPEPESWEIGAIVISGKDKLKIHFENRDTATIAMLQNAISDRIGVAPKRQRLLVKGKFIDTNNAMQLKLDDFLPSSKKSKRNSMLKVRLMHDAKFHDAQSSAESIKGSIGQRLKELERIVGGMHRKVQHNFFDEAQMIVSGRSYREEIDALAKSISLLHKSAAGCGIPATINDVEETRLRLEALQRMSDDIEEARMGSLRSKRSR